MWTKLLSFGSSFFTGRVLMFTYGVVLAAFVGLSAQVYLLGNKVDRLQLANELCDLENENKNSTILAQAGSIEKTKELLEVAEASNKIQVAALKDKLDSAKKLGETRAKKTNKLIVENKDWSSTELPDDIKKSLINR